jgi:hypothetical protein
MLDAAAKRFQALPRCGLPSRAPTLRLAASGRWTVQEFARPDGEIKMLNVVASGGVALQSGFDQAMKDPARWAASAAKGRSGARTS